jgi:hypothetical protein
LSPPEFSTEESFPPDVVSPDVVPPDVVSPDELPLVVPPVEDPGLVWVNSPFEGRVGTDGTVGT